MNIALAIKYIYPDADHINDYIVQDDNDGKGQYIAQWNLDAPLPTQEELEAAWEKCKDGINNPSNPVESPSDEVTFLREELTNTQLALTDTYEQLLQAQDESTSTQQALVDVYELLLTLMDAIMLNSAE